LFLRLSLQTVQLAVAELQARTADVEEAARKRAAAAKQYKQVSCRSCPSLPRASIHPSILTYLLTRAFSTFWFHVYQEARRLQVEVAELQHMLASEKSANLQLQQRVAALTTQHGEHVLAEQRHALELATQTAGCEAAQRRAEAAEAQAAEAMRQLEEAARVRSDLELILKRLVKTPHGAGAELGIAR
jgi:hypothetical protein